MSSTPLGQQEPDPRVGSVVALSIADAAVFLVSAFLLVDCSFLYVERLVSWPGLLFRDIWLLALGIAPMVAIGYLLKRPSGRLAAKVIFQALAMTAVFAILPYYYVIGFPWKPVLDTGYSNNWIPMDWHRLYLNLYIMWHASPAVFLAVTALFLCAVWFKARFRARYTWVISVLYLAIFVGMTSQAYKVENYPRHSTLHHFNVALIPVILVGLLPFSLWFGRILIGAHVLLIMTLFYFGLSPPPLTAHEPDSALFRRIFPGKHPDPRILLTFTRQGVVDREGTYLYQSFGPTSGIAKINVATGDVVGDPIQIRGLIRFFWTDWDSAYIIGANYISFDVHIIDKEPFALRKQWNLQHDEHPNSPFAVDVLPARDRFYIVYYEFGGIGEYALSDFRAIRKLYFKEAGISKYLTGGYQIAVDRQREKILVPIGIVDEQNRYKLLRIDAATLKVEDEVLYDGAGMGFVFVPEINRAFNTTFYGNDIYEFEIYPKLRIVKKVQGPYCSKSIQYDAVRDRLYASSFATGELFVLDRATGETLYKVFIGNKAENVYLHTLLDRLYVSSSSGIYELDLKKLDARLGTKAPSARALSAPAD